MATTKRTNPDPAGEAPLKARIKELEAQVAAYREAEAQVKVHMKVFDTLDFEVFSEQRWDRLGESHADDIRVIWPDGHDTRGIKTHIEDLKMMFIAMPDLAINTHPVAFGSGDWTVAIGVMEGTFTKPMPAGEGKTIRPNGNKVHLSMATISRWKNGHIAEEYLFWDNEAFKRQLGLI